MTDFQPHDKPAGFKRIRLATENSMRAFLWLSRNESAFRQELLATALLTIGSFFLDVSASERVLLFVALLVVLLVEIINTAIEIVVDRISLEHHPLSGMAKDLGSAAVFTSLLIACLTWVSIIFF